MSVTEDRLVRCCECREEYEEPPRGQEVACPRCGSRKWVSARFPVQPSDSGQR